MFSPCAHRVLNARKSGINFSNPEFRASFVRAQVGVLTKTLRGRGIAKLEYGNCWNAGKANVYLNGAKIGSSSPQTRAETLQFAFKNGDKLEVKDEEGNAVVQLIGLSAVCSGSTAPPATQTKGQSRTGTRSYNAIVMPPRPQDSIQSVAW